MLQCNLVRFFNLSLQLLGLLRLRDDTLSRVMVPLASACHHKIPNLLICNCARALRSEGNTFLLWKHCTRERRRVGRLTIETQISSGDQLVKERARFILVVQIAQVAFVSLLMIFVLINIDCVAVVKRRRSLTASVSLLCSSARQETDPSRKR